MLYMSIFTFNPEKRDEAVKRRTEKGAMVPEGVTVLGEWSSIGGGRVFRLVEIADARAGFAASFAWSDLGKIEHVPVMETEEVLKLIPGK